MNRHRLLLRNVSAVIENGERLTLRGVMPVAADSCVELECGHVIGKQEFNQTFDRASHLSARQVYCQQCAEIPHSKTNPEALERIEHEAARRAKGRAA